jgi:hypothetical protein
MKKIYTMSFLVIFFFFTTPNALANFGFGPCCPPSVCGIIPCDSGCAGAAINQMGSAIANALNSLNSAYQDLSSGVQDTMDSMNDLGADVGDALVQQNDDLLSAISASTNKIELANVIASKSLERNADHTNISFVSAQKEIEIARASSENIKVYGDMTNPVGGDTGTNQAQSIKKLITQMKQVSKSSTTDFIKYLNDENNTASGAGIGQHRMQSLTTLESFDKLHSMLTETTLDEIDFQNLQSLIGLVVSKYPLKESTKPNDTEYEISRRRHVAMLAMVYNALLVPTSSRMGLDDASWADFYQDVNPNVEGKIGLTGFYHAEINAKISDPEWWGSTLRLNEVGLEREKVYQSAISLQLKNRLGLISESSNELMAVLLAKKTETATRNLSVTFKQL